MNTHHLAKTAKVGLATWLGAVLVAGSAQAAILVDQPGSTLPGFASANVNGNGGGRAVFDDFMVASDFQLSRVEWTGGPVSAGLSLSNVSPSNLVAPSVLFLMSITADDGTGKPANSPLVGLAGGQVIDGTLLSSSPSGDVYRYALDLPGNVSLQGNTRYWLQLTALFSDDAPGLTWDWSDGANGNGIGAYYDTTLGTYLLGSGDRSFTLIGDTANTVPEPQTALLLAIAAAAGGLVTAGRRRRQG